VITGRNAAAKELGISPRALGKAFDSGRVSKTADGLYDVEQCREQLKRNSNPVKQANGRGRHSPRQAVVSSPSQNSTDASPEETPNDDRDDLRDITIQRELLKLKKERRDFHREGKRLVDGRKVRAETIERAASERQALLNIPKRWSPVLATQLGVEERKVYGALTALVREFLTERSTGPIEADGIPGFSSVIMQAAAAQQPSPIHSHA
jgi:hypothetical protein